MKTRREFTRFLALLAAGAAAKPEQIEAFEHYYHMNTPHENGTLVAIDEVKLSGMAQTSSPMRFELFKNDDSVLDIGINAFGGVWRWVAAPDQKIVAIASSISWIMHLRFPYGDANDWVRDNLVANISYIDQDGVRLLTKMKQCKGTLIKI